MKITKEWLKEKNACSEGLDWFLGQEETDLYRLIEKLRVHRPDWANWLVTRAMSKQQAIEYAIAAAELVLPLFEKEYSKDNRPATAIEAAKKALAENTEENRSAARDAADAAAYAAYVAAYAAYAAAYAAYAAAADAAAEVAAAEVAANAAAYAAEDANWEKVLDIAVGILKTGKDQ